MKAANLHHIWIVLILLHISVHVIYAKQNSTGTLQRHQKIATGRLRRQKTATVLKPDTIDHDNLNDSKNVKYKEKNQQKITEAVDNDNFDNFSIRAPAQSMQRLEQEETFSKDTINNRNKENKIELKHFVTCGKISSDNVSPSDATHWCPNKGKSPSPTEYYGSYKKSPGNYCWCGVSNNIEKKACQKHLDEKCNGVFPVLESINNMQYASHICTIHKGTKDRPPVSILTGCKREQNPKYSIKGECPLLIARYSNNSGIKNGTIKWIKSKNLIGVTTKCERILQCTNDLNFHPMKFSLICNHPKPYLTEYDEYKYCKLHQNVQNWPGVKGIKYIQQHCVEQTSLNTPLNKLNTTFNNNPGIRGDDDGIYHVQNQQEQEQNQQEQEQKDVQLVMLDDKQKDGQLVNQQEQEQNQQEQEQNDVQLVMLDDEGNIIPFQNTDEAKQNKSLKITKNDGDGVLDETTAILKSEKNEAAVYMGGITTQTTSNKKDPPTAVVSVVNVPPAVDIISPGLKKQNTSTVDEADEGESAFEVVEVAPPLENDAPVEVIARVPEATESQNKQIPAVKVIALPKVLEKGEKVITKEPTIQSSETIADELEISVGSKKDQNNQAVSEKSKEMVLLPPKHIAKPQFLLKCGMVTLSNLSPVSASHWCNDESKIPSPDQFEGEYFVERGNYCWCDDYGGGIEEMACKKHLKEHCTTPFPVLENIDTMKYASHVCTVDTDGTSVLIGCKFDKNNGSSSRGKCPMLKQSNDTNDSTDSTIKKLWSLSADAIENSPNCKRILICVNKPDNPTDFPLECLHQEKYIPGDTNTYGWCRLFDLKGAQRLPLYVSKNCRIR